MPKLLAEFELDDQGRPKCIQRDQRTHYQLRLFLEDTPEDASSVKYILDPTYLESVRLVPKGIADFQEYLTSYGDYEVKGVVNRRADDAERFGRTLTDALQERYGDQAAPEIRNAIEYLKEH